MSLSLTLGFRHTRSPGTPLMYSRLEFWACSYALADVLSPLATAISEPLYWYNDEGLEKLIEDPYGDPLDDDLGLEAGAGTGEVAEGAVLGPSCAGVPEPAAV